MKELFNYLIESASLRDDLKEKIVGILKNILDNIELTDRLVARLNDDAYEFIKEYKR